MILFGAELHDHRLARRKEFILTAGGAYCSSSLAGNTRKYHGLLVAGRRVYLSGLEEYVNGRRISVHRYAGSQENRGLLFLNGFELYPPRFYYMVDGASIKKTIAFNGKLTVRYDVEGEASLRLRPFITDRSYHETLRNVAFPFDSSASGFTSGKLSMQSSLPFKEDPQTYYDVFYERDAERGYDHIEDLYSPGYFQGCVKDASVTISASVEGLDEIFRSEAPPIDPIKSLELAADSFLTGDSLYAGYHWFAEPWGRDTFVSLPGLLLERGKFDEAKRVFRHFARYIKKGLIPNRIPGGYNSSDAPLWFIYALGKYFEKRDDPAFLRDAKSYVEKILSGYPESDVATLDGALVSVAAESTWMDTPHTARKGKAVEVNALWIKALELAGQMEIDAPVKPAAARREFDRFWNEKKGCLYDVIDPYDDSVRPDQAMAVALGAVEGEKARRSMDVVRKELLTPFGLRTLTPHDPRYAGRFGGDISYHNGCVWPWLMGFYVEAALRLGEPREKLVPLLEPLLLHTHDAGLGTISEIFDGDMPHEPNGCISQAWSVAEVIRAYHMLQPAP
jgi:glycogen debranching enzyme